MKAILCFLFGHKLRFVRRALEGLRTLSEQHRDRMIALDEEFIVAVLRPPVSIRKVRALVKRQALQPTLIP